MEPLAEPLAGSRSRAHMCTAATEGPMGFEVGAANTTDALAHCGTSEGVPRAQARQNRAVGIVPLAGR